MKDSGVREHRPWVLVGATMPAILIEKLAISQAQTIASILAKEPIKKIANGIANGIDAYF